MSLLQTADVGVMKEGRWLIQGANLAVNEGEVTALVGPNGSGKSTLLKLLCRLWRPTEGTVALDGKDLQTYSAREIAKRITIVQQSLTLRYSFTVLEVVAMGRYPHTGRIGRLSEMDLQIVESAMEKADVLPLADRHANRLSGGELQRVLLARCLATEASIILLDEPTSNLDLSHALDVLHLCRELAHEGKSVAIALHDLSSALRFADQVAVLSSGRVIDSGPTDAVLSPEKIQSVFSVRAERVRASTGQEGFLFDRDKDLS
ncbi:MAG: ABC transporter ATP-binding protein [Candidatus Omnitrophica bacterium]|nr:ABC transporter ATP-binding protein [Candidatus Omnitrophota bacterium]